MQFVVDFLLAPGTLKITLSPFNSHFPGEPGLGGVYWSRGWWRWWWQLDYWSCKSCKAPVKSSPPTNQHPVFYRPDALPVVQPTVSKHWRKKYHIPWTCLPQAHLGIFQLRLWPLIASGYLVSRLMPVPHNSTTYFLPYWQYVAKVHLHLQISLKCQR